MLVEHLAHGGLGLGAGEAINGLPLFDDHYRRQRTHAQLLRQHLLLIRVDLGQQKSALIFIGQLLEYRHQLFTGAAPVSPEVDDYRARHGFVDQ